MIYRVRRMDCGNCWHHQRCSYLVFGSTEVAPNCESCGRTDTWMSLPRIPVEQIVAEEQQRAAMARMMQGGMFGFGLPGPIQAFIEMMLGGESPFKEE